LSIGVPAAKRRVMMTDPSAVYENVLRVKCDLGCGQVSLGVLLFIGRRPAGVFVRHESHLQSWNDLRPRVVDISEVCDVNPARAEATAEKFSVPCS
jgi:hypothetical protein